MPSFNKTVQSDAVAYRLNGTPLEVVQRPTGAFSIRRVTFRGAELIDATTYSALDAAKAQAVRLAKGEGLDGMIAEHDICAKLVADILAAGYAVSVYDGETMTLKRATSPDKILAAMFTTDADHLYVGAPDGGSLGWIHLVYGNGCDVISDNTDTPALQALMNGAEALADKLA